MAKLSAFADEVVDDFRGQVEFLAQEKVGFIEPRFVDKKNLMDLNRQELAQVRTLIRDHGLKVSAIGSPIGKVRLDQPFKPHLDKFKHAVELAQYLETPFIRMFSYYAPEGKNIDDYRFQVMDRMVAKLEVLAGGYGQNTRFAQTAAGLRPGQLRLGREDHE
jgi:sugar phosphate isomerase/epimerase